MILHGYQLVIAKSLFQFYEFWCAFKQPKELAEELKEQQQRVMVLGLE